jgi:hypothetical protein
MLRKLIGAGAIIIVLTGAAAAQLPMPGLSLGGDHTRKLTPEEQARQDATDKAYRATMQKIPEKKTAADPWGNIRETSPAPSKTKPPQ